MTSDSAALTFNLGNLYFETGKLEEISFDTISGTGPNGAIVHYRVTEETDSVLEDGHLIVLDSGGQPVPAAEVQIRATRSGQVIYAGTTYGDGQAPFYPRGYDTGRAAGDLLVEVCRV